MIILMKRAPILVLETAILEDMKRHCSAEAPYGMILLPHVHRSNLGTDFRIALEYRCTEVTPLVMEFIQGIVLPSNFTQLPRQVRVPYILFQYSEQFACRHSDALRLGHTAHALIQKLTTVQR